jgi:thioredoxin-dependent peroxiredoxin
VQAPPDVGEEAPDFALPDQHGREVRLSALRGRPVLLYFYPQDGTPGCTVQARGIRDAWAAFADRGVAVLGISPDPVADHAAFCAAESLPQTLLSDPDHVVLERYGAWGEKVLYGRRSVGVIRSSVLLDAEGRVAKVWRRVQTASHADRVLAAVAALRS